MTPPEMSSTLSLAHTLHDVALGVMALVYTIRLFWVLKFKAGQERQARTGRLDTSRVKGAAYSLANIFMPWAMESTRKRPLFYLQFVIFHLGVVAAISLSGIISHAPWLLADVPILVTVMQVLTGAACVVGLMRIIRRVSSPVMRLISTPDDYFAVSLLTVWFFFAALAAPNDVSGGETIQLVYYFMTVFFLLYVPFSKISHYLYYPFTRYYLGKTLGHRGVFPLQRGPQVSASEENRQLELSEQKEG